LTFVNRIAASRGSKFDPLANERPQTVIIEHWIDLRNYESPEGKPDWYSPGLLDGSFMDTQATDPTAVPHGTKDSSPYPRNAGLGT
jgi:hypothetical protein